MANKKVNANKIFDEKNLRSADLKKSTGLTYRQIHDWQSKGVLPDKRKDKKKWKTFSAKEVFAMIVCKEIRNKFGVPLEALNFVKSFMLKEEANYLKYAFEMMLNYGFTIYLF